MLDMKARNNFLTKVMLKELEIYVDPHHTARCCGSQKIFDAGFNPATKEPDSKKVLGGFKTRNRLALLPYEMEH